MLNICGPFNISTITVFAEQTMKKVSQCYFQHAVAHGKYQRKKQR